MEALMGHPASDISLETKWGKMVIVSIVLHLAVFSMVLFVPDATTTRKIRGTVYEVNLVELPKGKQPRVQKRNRAKAGVRTKAGTVKKLAPAKTASVDKLPRLQSKANPLVIAKKTVKTKTKKLVPPQDRDTSKNHVDQALARIKKNVKETTATGPDLPSLEVPATDTGGNVQAGRAENGILILMYQNDVEALIKDNWSFPAHGDENPAAIVVLTVQKNGTILKTLITQSSGDERFDQSVLKAIKRSDPLPPFPAGYRKTHEEIEINFNLSELDNP